MHAVSTGSRALLVRVEGDADLSLGNSVAFTVEGEVRRRKRVKRDARKELRDHFGKKLPRHTGRQQPRRTSQFFRHDAQELLSTLLSRTPYCSANPNPRRPTLKPSKTSSARMFS